MSLCSSFLTTDGRVGNPLGFCFVYEMLPFITAFFGCFSSLNGPDHLFDQFPTITRIFLSFLFVFL
jgi:hypothetical protein